MKSPLKKKLTEKEYSALVEMTTLTLPEFLGYALEKYPHIEGQEFYEFYLKQRALRLGRPLSLHCELTPLCNLSCKMCYVQLDESNAGLHSILTTSQWMEIFRQAIENDVYQVTLSGGEAMLHPGFWEIYDYLYSMGIRITIFTNGLSITNRAIEHLRKKPPQSIQISLYGTSDDVYEKVTGKRVFSQIEKVFLQLQEANIPFKIAVSPNRYLYNDMENILQYLYNKGYSFQVNRNLLPPREETGRNLKDIALTTNEYVDIWTLYKKTTNMHPFSEEIRDNQDGISCSAGMATCHINYKGEMNGCVLLQLSNEDVLKQGFNDAWERIHKQCMSYSIPSKCKDCSNATVCSYCPAEHFIVNNEVTCNIDICNRTEEYLSNELISKG